MPYRRLQQFHYNYFLVVRDMQEAVSGKLIRIDAEREIYRMGNIGAGKFGTVYQGYDKLNSRMVALKYVSNNKEETWRKEIQALEMFDHPNIIKYYCYIPEKAQNSDEIAGVYIVTQFVRGKTLDKYIGSAEKVGEKGLSEPMVLKLFSQLLDGYGYIHNKDYVHRDIKPQNILVDENENIKIIDFGQSKERKLLKTLGLGTPLYSAPETFADKVPADFRRDVWSLGLVLYEMITGKCYFEEQKEFNQGNFIKHLLSHRVRIKFPQNFSPFWTEIAKKMLQKDYTRRINLHEIKFEMKKQQPDFEKRLNPLSVQHPVVKASILMASGNTNPLTQSQNQFQFSRTKKYLRFFNNKYKFLILLSQFLTRFSYPFLSNAHKLILVYLSLNIYVAVIDHLLKRLEKNRIKITDNEIFDVESFQEPYKSAMKEHLLVYRDYYEKESRITKDVLLEKIIPRFAFPEKSSSSETGSASSGAQSIPPYELLEQYPQIKKQMQDFKQGINYPKSHYLSRFQQLLFSPAFYHSEEHIRKYFYQEDMVVYYLMLIVCHIDEMLQWKNQYFGNEIPKLKEELGHSLRDKEEVQELIGKIRKYNREKDKEKEKEKEKEKA